MPHLFIFGFGYTAQTIAKRPELAGWRVDATGSAGSIDFDDVARVQSALAQADQVLSSVPPAEGGDPVLERYGDALAACGAPLSYLSSTGVYGDRDGAWVDEATPSIATSGTGRREARAAADAAWLALGARVYRLPGIYGPGRSPLDRVREGRARRIDMPGQVFSRVHVEDIASGVIAGFEREAPAGAYNLGDDLPASGNAVIEEACMLLGLEPPPIQTLEAADLSPMARGFYAENRRVANGKAKRVLGWRLKYPTYKQGLASLV